jgi:hypothetical protein
MRGISALDTPDRLESRDIRLFVLCPLRCRFPARPCVRLPSTDTLCAAVGENLALAPVWADRTNTAGARGNESEARASDPRMRSPAMNGPDMLVVTSTNAGAARVERCGIARDNRVDGSYCTRTFGAGLCRRCCAVDSLPRRKPKLSSFTALLFLPFHSGKICLALYQRITF